MTNNPLSLSNSLDVLLLQNSINKLSNFSKLNSLNTLSTNLNSDLSYSKILEAMKKKVDDEKTLNELSELEEKYQKEMAPIRMFDLFHDTYITNGFFGRSTKKQMRNAKYNAWNSIFSLQAERLNAETQIALKSAIRQTAQKVK